MSVRALLTTALRLCGTLHAAPPPAPKVGDQPPDFLGRTDAGEDVRVSAQAGKVVVVSFWASWCAPCRKELPILENLQRAAGPGRIKVVAVNIDESLWDFKKIQKALKDATLTLVYDKGGAVAKSYGVKVIPNMTLIGRDGRVAHAHVGYGEETIDTLVDEINGLLSQPAESVATAPQ